jgi:hypothetical protein
MPDITNHEGNSWLNDAKVGRESRKNGDSNIDNGTSKGVDIEPPPCATEGERRAMEEHQPDKIRPEAVPSAGCEFAFLQNPYVDRAS